jgi:putative transposase
MRQSRFTEDRIIGMIQEQEAGMPTAEVCRKHDFSPASFYKLKAKYVAIHRTAGYRAAMSQE